MKIQYHEVMNPSINALPGIQLKAGVHAALIITSTEEGDGSIIELELCFSLKSEPDKEARLQFEDAIRWERVTMLAEIPKLWERAKDLMEDGYPPNEAFLAIAFAPDLETLWSLKLDFEHNDDKGETDLFFILRRNRSQDNHASSTIKDLEAFLEFDPKIFSDSEEDEAD